MRCPRWPHLDVSRAARRALHPPGEIGERHVAIAIKEPLESQDNPTMAVAAFGLDAGGLSREIRERRWRVGRRRTGAGHAAGYRTAPPATMCLGLAAKR